MLPLDIPPGSTIESLVTHVIPEMHRRMVDEGGPADVFTVVIRIEGRGSWTARICGSSMRVHEGEEGRPTLWMYTTEVMAQRFLSDALGPKRLLAKLPAGNAARGVRTMSDPRVIKRLALASGRIELAVVDEAGQRIAILLGFGDAARRPIAHENPDTVAEAPLAILEAMLRGEHGPEETLSDPSVTMRGSRLLALQLALAVAPFLPAAQATERRTHRRDGR
jgi:hypothetical protein